MERKHKRCCFKRSGSICMIREIHSISGSSTQESKIIGPATTTDKRLPTTTLESSRLSVLKTIPTSRQEPKKQPSTAKVNNENKDKPKAKIKNKNHGIISTMRKILRSRKENRQVRKAIAKQPKDSISNKIGLEEEDIRKLIRLYCKHDNLYNPKNFYYGNKEIDEDCYNDMARSFPNHTSADLRACMEELRSLFEREYTIIENARFNYDEMLQPSIPHYNEFLFLVPHLRINFDKTTKSKSVCSMPTQSNSDLSNRSKLSTQLPLQLSKSISSILSTASSHQKSKSPSVQSCQKQSLLETPLVVQQPFRNYTGSSITAVMGAAMLGSSVPTLQIKSNSKCLCCSGGGGIFEKEKPSTKNDKAGLEPKVQGFCECATVGNQTSKQSLNGSVYSRESPVESDLTCRFTPNENGQCVPCCRQPTVPQQPPNSDKSAQSDGYPLNTQPQKGCSCQPQEEAMGGGGATNSVQVQMLCDMIRTELLDAPDFIYFDAKWRIIEILREVHKRQLVHMKATPQNGSMSSQKTCTNPSQSTCLIPPQVKFSSNYGPPVLSLCENSEGKGTSSGTGKRKSKSSRLCDSKSMKSNHCPYCCRH